MSGAVGWDVVMWKQETITAWTMPEGSRPERVEVEKKFLLQRVGAQAGFGGEVEIEGERVRLCFLPRVFG